jgi:hypothetical protein
MQFLQLEVHLKCELPVRPLEFYSERLRFPSRNSLSAQQRSEPSVHFVTAHPQFHRRYQYSASSQSHGTWQGVAA